MTITSRFSPLFIAAIAFLYWGLSPAVAQEAPHVVKMVPENGATDVNPKLKEIVITFSEPMMDKSWSVTGGGDNYPDIKSIYYKKNCTQLVMKVKLKPGWFYQFGINSPSFRNFKSKKGIPVKPMQVSFQTKGKRSAQGAKPTVPHIVKMEPENGATDVDPKLKEIVITFSEPMMDRCWSVTGGGNDFPEVKKIFYTENCTKLVIKVELEPGKTYRFGINSPSQKNFKNKKGIPVEPVPVKFETAGKRKEEQKSSDLDLPVKGKVEFALTDTNGFEIRSEDYLGSPIFMITGPAW